MPRAATIDPERILSAAREVFLEQGFTGSTAEIARRAQVSEGSLFKRHGTKEALFLAAMGHSPGGWTDALALRAGMGDVREQLIQVGLEMLAGYRESVPRLIVGLGAKVGAFSLPYAEELRALSRYLEAEMKLGRLRGADPMIAARTLLSSIQGHALMELTDVNAQLPVSERNYVRSVVDVLLAGLGRQSESALTEA